MNPHRGRFVSYCRVSTLRQGASGLGLAAQKKAVADFLNGGSWKLIGEFVETESGKHADRPELLKALALCKRERATLVIAKLDRLSRNVAFLATLLDRGIDFVACDNPHANKLTVHILAAVAQHEREQIADRTKRALAAAKSKGTKLGNPRLAEFRGKAHAANKAAARRFAENTAPVMREIRASGITSNRGIARALTARGIATARGGQWTAVQVGDILRRVDR